MQWGDLRRDTDMSAFYFGIQRLIEHDSAYAYKVHQQD